jgi:SAM-dependent methyltransferase
MSIRMRSHAFANGREDIVELDLATFARPASAHELALLTQLDGPVLDVGCGPGRLVAALTARGVPALGIDLAPLAVDLAVARAAPVLAHSVFDRVPGEGRWPTVLLFDGNIGIGGEPRDLLRRVAELLAPRGVAVVELEPPGVASRKSTARLDLGIGVTGWLPWARVSVDDAERLAAAAGLAMTRARWEGERWFAWLRRPARRV